MRAFAAPLLVLVVAASACRRDSLEMPPTEPQALTQPAPASDEPTADEPTEDPARDPTKPATIPRKARPGFSKVTADDQGPLCVFTDFAARDLAPFPQDAKPQKLKADASVVFGAYPPWCVHESCDQIPSLQCKVTREEGNVLAVHTHFWGEHKDGSRCTEDCRPITAGCETPALEAGKYTVRHGEQSYALRIPSTVRSPCFQPKPASGQSATRVQ